MKKITFILFALIAGTAFGQSSADGNATVNALVVSPISVTQGTNLEFGRIIGNANGGIITVSTADQRTDNSNNALLAPSTTVQAASFTVKAANTYNYSITIPSIELLGAGTPMPVTFTSSLGSASTDTEGNVTAGVYTGLAGTGADQALKVGGALTVNPNQAEGAYTGTVKVTVAYE